VKREGNKPAQELINQVFEVSDRKWRGIGEIQQSGLRLEPEFSAFDAERHFKLEEITAEESPECISGIILQGLKKPNQCPAFAIRCTPQTPLGATMVSSEGLVLPTFATIVSALRIPRYLRQANRHEENYPR